MAFVQATKKTMDEYLLGTHTDYITCWATVHDEVDYVVPLAIRNGVMKKVSHVGSLKDLFDKFKLPGLSMLYDIEFDKYNSWTAGSSVPIYQYPMNRQEDVMRKMWEESKKNAPPRSERTTPTGKVVTIPLHEVTETWLSKLSSLKDGSDTVMIQTGSGGFFEYERRVSYTL